jgi:hypothetical protein
MPHHIGQGRSSQRSQRGRHVVEDNVIEVNIRWDHPRVFLPMLVKRKEGLPVGMHLNPQYGSDSPTIKPWAREELCQEGSGNADPGYDQFSQDAPPFSWL